MNHSTLPECDYSDPSSVVTTFISAMNSWETKSWRAMRDARLTNDPSVYQEEVAKELAQIFAAYCTAKERPQGRQSSFQKPPEYDPTIETVQGVSIVSQHKAIVETERNSILGPGRYRYIIHRISDSWLIDNLKHQQKGVWEKSIL